MEPVTSLLAGLNYLAWAGCVVPILVCYKVITDYFPVWLRGWLGISHAGIPQVLAVIKIIMVSKIAWGFPTQTLLAQKSMDVFM
jgi:hypothetical protein